MHTNEFVIVNGVKPTTGLTPNGMFANVAVSNMGTNDAPYIFRMKEGEEWTFFNYGRASPTRGAGPWNGR
ncbi:MAG: hypothetical protein IPN85_15120 [Flavobacteriales bacterium]|nr:hypothetical protein [Flavobacteriales bacterium]